MCQLYPKKCLGFGMFFFGILFLGIAGLSFWIAVEINRGNVNFINLVTDISSKLSDDISYEKVQVWWYRGFLIFGGVHTLIGFLAILNALKYHPCWCIPLSILTAFFFLIWGSSFAGVIVGKHYINKTSELCPPSAGSGWEKINDVYNLASSILCSSECPCDIEY